MSRKAETMAAEQSRAGPVERDIELVIFLFSFLLIN